MEKEFSSEMAKILKTAKVNSTTELNENVLLKLTKNPLADIIVRLVNLCEKNLNTCKSAASKLDQMKTAQIESQKKLLEIQQERIDSVQQTVKTELKSWADVVKKGYDSNKLKQLTTQSVKEAVKSVNDEEKRSKCFLIYGCEEQEDEGDRSCEIAQEIYCKVGFRPPVIVDAYRIGNRTEGRTRPIKVEVEHPTDVHVLLKSAHKLRASDMTSVYLAPDRTKEQRTAHKKLVTEMKSMIERDPSKYYYIRNNKINCIDKATSSDSA